MSNPRFGVGSFNSWSWAEMLLGLSILRSSKKECVCSSRGLHDKFINGHALSSWFSNSSSSSLSESKSSNSHLWYLIKSMIISHRSDNHNDFVLSLKIFVNLWEWDWRSVSSGCDKSSQNGLAESWISSSAQESEKLNKKMRVKVSTSWIFLVRILNSTSLDEINSLNNRIRS